MLQNEGSVHISTQFFSMIMLYNSSSGFTTHTPSSGSLE